MNQQPKEIEERLIQQIISIHKKMRQWKKRLLVISTVAATLLLVQALRSAGGGHYDIAVLDLLLAAFNILITNQAYRRLI